MALRVIKAAEKSAVFRDGELSRTVAEIVSAVRERGEAALAEYSERFDRVKPDGLVLDQKTVEAAYREVPQKTVEAMRFSCARIRAFAEKQLACIRPLHYADETIPGLELGHRLVPVEKAGCYVPAGRYPLPSSALMSITTAKAAGVKTVLACSPPAPGGDSIHPAVLVAMDIAGADGIFCMGGAQAVAAFAYGAGPVAKVDVIAGPGNRYVTEAKRQVLGDVGIDGLAGPSEVLIIADKTANPRWLAMDLLAQAEHDSDAKCILVCTSETAAEKTQAEIENLLKELPTGETAAQSWRKNGAVYLADSLEEAAAFSNGAAPEHLEVQIDPAQEKNFAEQLEHFGSLFVGHYAPVAFGDFVTGTNHILPTMGTARFASGLWAGTFLKAAFRQYVSREAFDALAENAMIFAETEGLATHRDSVRIRKTDR